MDPLFLNGNLAWFNDQFDACPHVVVDRNIHIHHDPVPNIRYYYCYRISASRKESRMQKWEYLRLDITYLEDTARVTPNFDLTRVFSVKTAELLPALDRLGKQNWEMMSVFGSGEHEIYYFKRPVE
jgi:hypothetical protein